MVLVDGSVSDAASGGSGRHASVLDTLRERAEAVADIAAMEAVRVDRDGVFPTAGIEAAKRNGFMSLLIPRELGGAGAPLSAVADVCYTLGQACASTAMIVAMHQAALACVVRHHGGSEWHRAFLRRVASDALLLASSTTEGTTGGNVRASDAAVIVDGDRIRFERAATVMSYGQQADGIVSVARRHPEAAPSDQVLLVLLREDYELDRTGGWDTLGMRGTCSSGFGLRATARPEQVLPIGYDKIHPQTMVPVSHLTWAGLWAGIAAASVARSQAFLRTAARRSGGQMPPGPAQFTRASASLRTLRGMIAAALAAYERMEDTPQVLGGIDNQAALNLFKVEASEHAIATVMSAMRACGLAGYRNDGEFGIGRHLRDVLSSPIMIHNERILANIQNVALMSGVPRSLQD